MHSIRGLSPIALILIGFLMTLAGFVALFLIVIRVIEASFLLNFLSYGMSFAGLLLGVAGITQFTSDRHREF